MGEFFLEYGLFLAKTLTFLVAIFFVLSMVAGMSRRSQQPETLRVENLNERYRLMTSRLRTAITHKSGIKALRKRLKAQSKAEKELADRPKTFLIEFKGDIKASAVASLREEVTAVLAVAGDDDEVIVRIENPGGVVHEHGLAAAQLIRLRDRGIRVTVAVDKIAASGGYLMACVGDRIVAAPFAILGSIGVIAQLPNFHRLLDEKGIDFEQITAGKYKRTVTVFGENTDEDRAKLKAELEDVHRLFKDVVARFRPQLDLERVATGEHWYGRQALDLGLADELATSDDLLVRAVGDRDLFRVHYELKQPLPKKLMGSVDGVLERGLDRVMERLRNLRFGG